MSSKKVLAIEDFRGPIYKFLSSDLKSLFLDHKSSKIVKDFAFCKQSMIDDMMSMNSIITITHDDTVKNVLLTGVRYYLLINVSK